MRLKALTLVEIVVALLISSIFLAICFQGLHYFNKAFKSVKERDEEQFVTAQAIQVLEKDCIRANRAFKSGNQLELFLADSLIIQYQFNEQELIRTVNRNKDHFPFQSSINYYFEQQNINQKAFSLVDQICLDQNCFKIYNDALSNHLFLKR